MALITWFLNTKLGRWLMIAGAAFLALVTFGMIKKREGARELEAEQREESARRIKEARDAADKTREDLRDASDDDIDQRVRDSGL